MRWSKFLNGCKAPLAHLKHQSLKGRLENKSDPTPKSDKNIFYFFWILDRFLSRFWKKNFAQRKAKKMGYECMLNSNRKIWYEHTLNSNRKTWYERTIKSYSKMGYEHVLKSNRKMRYEHTPNSNRNMGFEHMLNINRKMGYECMLKPKVWLRIFTLFEDLNAYLCLILILNSSV